MDKIENNEEWTRLFSVVKKSLEAHIKMEEEDIFALAQEYFSDEEAEKIASAMNKIKDKMLKEYKQ